MPFQMPPARECLPDLRPTFLSIVAEPQGIVFFCPTGSGHCDLLNWKNHHGKTERIAKGTTRKIVLAIGQRSAGEPKVMW